MTPKFNQHASNWNQTTKYQMLRVCSSGALFAKIRAPHHPWPGSPGVGTHLRWHKLWGEKCWRIILTKIDCSKLSLNAMRTHQVASRAARDEAWAAPLRPWLVEGLDSQVALCHWECSTHSHNTLLSLTDVFQIASDPDTSPWVAASTLSVSRYPQYWEWLRSSLALNV